jgi:hypothetical protein
VFVAFSSVESDPALVPVPQASVTAAQNLHRQTQTTKMQIQFDWRDAQDLLTMMNREKIENDDAGHLQNSKEIHRALIRPGNCIGDGNERLSEMGKEWMERRRSPSEGAQVGDSK